MRAEPLSSLGLSAPADQPSLPPKASCISLGDITLQGRLFSPLISLPQPLLLLAVLSSFGNLPNAMLRTMPGAGLAAGAELTLHWALVPLRSPSLSW